MKLPIKTKAQATGSAYSSEQLEHQRLASLINSMADAVVAVDEATNIMLYNGALLNILDTNTIKIGTPLAKIFKPLGKDNTSADVKAMIYEAATPTVSRDLRLHYGDGSYINLYVSIAPVYLGNSVDGQQGYVLLLRDITREKSLEEERDEFISVVSHELRTPIAIAEGNISNAQLISEKSGDLAIKQALNEAHNQVLFLAAMINDLSTLSRAERGKLIMEIEDVDVPKMVKELHSNYQTEAIAKDLTLRIVLDPQLQPLRTCQLYLREILQNFITNAIKYSYHGAVTISATKAADGVRFAVQDNGIGISKSDQEHVFDKFFRSDDSRTREAKGTGLGLYVTMKLIKLLNGTLQLKSELNEGTTFTIFLPDLD